MCTDEILYELAEQIVNDDASLADEIRHDLHDVHKPLLKLRAGVLEHRRMAAAGRPFG